MTVQEVPEDPAQAIPDADPESVARAIVLRRLTMSAQTRQQLEQALARKQVPDDVARRVAAAACGDQWACASLHGANTSNTAESQPRGGGTAGELGWKVRLL